MRISVIVTVLDERESIRTLLESLLRQSPPPDEIVVADAGSTDGTREAILELAGQYGAIRLVDQPGDRSTGRNAAIRAATGDAIACTDGGCVADPGWLEAITAPLRRGGDWVAGFYRVEGESVRSTCVGLAMVYVAEEVDPEEFLPSARSMAFRKEVWSRVGGFPEGVRFAEDTLFDERLLAAGYRAEFVENATVRWRPPPGLAGLARTSFRWGHGDGLAGLRGAHFRRLIAVYGGGLLLVLLAPLVRWWLVPLAALPLAVTVASRTRHKYGHVSGLAKYLLIPLTHLVAVVGSISGFLAGAATRFLGRRAEPS